MNISRLYVLINHIHHIIILLVYNFLAIMNKTTKIQKCNFRWFELCLKMLQKTKNEKNKYSVDYFL
jgi:hypothetical protein